MRHGLTRKICAMSKLRKKKCFPAHPPDLKHHDENREKFRVRFELVTTA